MTNIQKDLSEVVEANITYHSALATEYNSTQPHFKLENVARVEQVISDMAAKTGGNSLLDLGCGTGFIIDIAKKYFQRVVGVDVTPAMLEQVDMNNGQVTLYETSTEDIPLPDDEFDACTAYSFLHHLYDLQPTIQEAYRCLRPGGLFYSDQDPNYHYWALMHELNQRDDLTGIAKREMTSVVFDVEAVVEETGLKPDVVLLAEFQMKQKGGLNVDKVVPLMNEIGFSSVDYHYEWFFGQGKVLHQQSEADVTTIDNFLREGLPATQHLFKYISFYGAK